MGWTIQNITAGTPAQSLADLKIGKPTLEFQSQAEDYLNLPVAGRNFDLSDVFAYGDIISLKKDGTQLFYGPIIDTDVYGDPNAEGHTYRAASPWWQLSNLTYIQNWGRADGIASSIELSVVVLGQNDLGASRTTGQQIQDILTYAITKGVNLQIGTIDVDITAPFEEVRDMSCDECIRRCLRWSPDAVAKFDYTTTPPTLNIRKRANGTVRSFAIGAAPFKLFRIKPRNDLKPAGVIVNYQYQNTIDGQSVLTYSEDVYPLATTNAKGVLFYTVPMGGYSKISQKQEVEVAVLPGTSSLDLYSGAGKTFWDAHFPWLKDSAVSAISISGSLIDPSTNIYANYLVDGTIHNWMNVNVAEKTVSAKFTWTETDTAGKKTTYTSVLKSVKILNTDATTKTYKKTLTTSQQETPPVGLAQKLYTSLATLQYEGSFELVENEYTGLVGIGDVVNYTGGRAAWATMNALVQHIVVDIDSGRTTVDFGPPAHISISDFIELQRINRTHKPSIQFSSRVSGAGGSEGEVESGKKVPRNNSSRSSGIPTSFVVLKTTGSGTVTIQAREIDVCDGGSVKKAMAYISEAY